MSYGPVAIAFRYWHAVCDAIMPALTIEPHKFPTMESSGRLHVQKRISNATRPGFPPSRPARDRRIDPRRHVAAATCFRQGYRRWLHLRRVTRRLWIQSGAYGGRGRAQETPGDQGHRRREGAGNRRGRENHGVHDQSRWRDAAVSDFVWLLQPPHGQACQQVSEAALRALRWSVGRQGSEERR